MEIRKLIVDEFGSQTALARLLGVTDSSMSEMVNKGFPPLRALEVEKLSGFRIKAVWLNPTAEEFRARIKAVA